MKDIARTPLHNACFKHSFIESLTGDDESFERASRETPGLCYARVDPIQPPAPELALWSSTLAAELGILGPEEDPTLVDILSGGSIPECLRPYAARYGGHQFGHWAGQLGDGRAITLGELIAHSGKRYELQLKGAGQTPYSRRADGRAVLRSSLREFLCSEAMYHLGIPTTRALSLVTTGESVLRDMFYDGHPEEEPGAIVCRVAESFLRFGNFEIHARRNEHELLKALCQYTLQHFTPSGSSTKEPTPEAICEWFIELCKKTALLVVDWMRVGFVHGVLNTDNMSILGLTIDYGPYGWLEGYDHNWTPNTTDATHRRYAYGQQPAIALWNLARLAEALSPLVPDTRMLEASIAEYQNTFRSQYKAMIARKLGFPNSSEDIFPEDIATELIEPLFALLQSSEVDMTIFFRTLIAVRDPDASEEARSTAIRQLAAAAYEESAYSRTTAPLLLQWLENYWHHLREQGISAAAREECMLRTNPKYVLRNYLVHEACLDAAHGDFRKADRLLTLIHNPYDEQPEHEELAGRRPAWAANAPGCAFLSCSS